MFIVRHKETGTFLAKRMVQQDPRPKLVSNPFKALQFSDAERAANYVAGETYAQLPEWKAYMRELGDAAIYGRTPIIKKPPKNTTNVMNDFELIPIFVITAFDYDAASKLPSVYGIQ